MKLHPPSVAAVLLLFLALLAPTASGQLIPCDEPYDCASGCGDGVCVIGQESCTTCPFDCGACGPSCLEPPSGLAAFWTFDSSTSYAYPDQVNSNFAIKHNGVSRTAGKVGQAAYFDGVNDYLIVEDSDDIDFSTGDFSIVAWTRVAPNDGGALLDKSDGSGTWPPGWTFHVGWWPTLFFSDGSPPTATNNSMVNADDNQWHLVAVTVDRNQPSGLKSYFDGVLKISESPLDQQGSVSNTGDLVIGNFVSLQSTGFWQGSLDELQIYKRALTSTEVQRIYDRGASGLCRPDAPSTCPGGSSCSVDLDCGFTQTLGLLGGCYSGTCICK